MAWQVPPTFVDGTTSNHGDMNIVTNDVNWLKGHADICGGHAFKGYTEDYCMGAETWRTVWCGKILHQANKMYSSIHIQSRWVGKDTQVRLVMGGVVLDTKTCVAQYGLENSWVSIVSPIDLSALGFNKYQWYLVEVQTKSLDTWACYKVKVQAVYESAL